MSLDFFLSQDFFFFFSPQSASDFPISRIKVKNVFFKVYLIFFSVDERKGKLLFGVCGDRHCNGLTLFQRQTTTTRTTGRKITRKVTATVQVSE
jgi:hypothetical protein